MSKPRYRIKAQTVRSHQASFTSPFLRKNEASSLFPAAAKGRRTGYQTPPSGLINQLLLGSLPLQRSAARAAYYQVDWVKSGVNSLTASIISEGIRPTPTQLDKSVKTKIKELWSRWVEEADTTGRLDFYGLQKLAVKEMINKGESFLRLRYRQAGTMEVPLQLQGLDPSWFPIDNLNKNYTNSYIIGGVEFDRRESIIYYHMLDRKPDDTQKNFKTYRVKADEIVHLFEPEEFGQVRGIPFLSSSFLRLKDLSEYEDAELVRKKIAAMYAGFITSQRPDQLVSGAEGFNDLSPEDQEDMEGNQVIGLEPGTLNYLDPGENIEFSSPAEVGGSFEIFMKTNLRAIASGLGITYEQMTGDLSGVNFSSIRAGLLEHQRRAKPLQNLVKQQFCRKVWNGWIKAALLGGALETQDFDGKTRIFANWVAPGWAYVNPVQEVTAKKTAVRSGFVPLSEVIEESGRDPDEVLNQIFEDVAKIDEYGLAVDTDPRRTTSSGNASNNDPDNLALTNNQDEIEKDT